MSALGMYLVLIPNDLIKLLTDWSVGMYNKRYTNNI